MSNALPELQYISFFLFCLYHIKSNIMFRLDWHNCLYKTFYCSLLCSLFHNLFIFSVVFFFLLLLRPYSLSEGGWYSIRWLKSFRVSKISIQRSLKLSCRYFPSVCVAYSLLYESCNIEVTFTNSLGEDYGFLNFDSANLMKHLTHTQGSRNI